MKNFVKVYQGEPNTRILNYGNFTVRLYNTDGSVMPFYNKFGYIQWSSQNILSERGVKKYIKNLLNINADISNDIGFIEASSRFINNDIYFIKIED